MSSIPLLAGGPGLIQHLIKLRVPPVPRFWGPGMESRTAGSAFTQAVANLCLLITYALAFPAQPGYSYRESGGGEM